MLLIWTKYWWSPPSMAMLISQARWMGSDYLMLQAGRSNLGNGWAFADFNYDGTSADLADYQFYGDRIGFSLNGPQYARAFQPAGIVINPWRTSLSPATSRPAAEMSDD
jgi:hypothetical protein